MLHPRLNLFSPSHLTCQPTTKTMVGLLITTSTPTVQGTVPPQTSVPGPQQTRTATTNPHNQTYTTLTMLTGKSSTYHHPQPTHHYRFHTGIQSTLMTRAEPLAASFQIGMPLEQRGTHTNSKGPVCLCSPWCQTLCLRQTKLTPETTGNPKVKLLRLRGTIPRRIVFAIG